MHSFAKKKKWINETDHGYSVTLSICPLVNWELNINKKTPVCNF